ncbi:unnamed protein product [Closterium sp. Naga37s-1]|nr:unnamed protein product [Closterium sp. Naga37s-1]
MWQSETVGLLGPNGAGKSTTFSVAVPFVTHPKWHHYHANNPPPLSYLFPLQVGLLGPNGAGKSTTFSIAVGRETPTAGAVRLGGADVTGLPLERRARMGVAFLAQEASIFRGLSVADNIRLVLEEGPLPYHLHDARIEELLRKFDLVHVAHTMGRHLSGGERRRAVRASECHIACACVRALACTFTCVLVSHAGRDTDRPALMWRSSSAHPAMLLLILSLPLPYPPPPTPLDTQEVARALAVKDSECNPPRLLMVDEPFAGVDPIGVQLMQSMLCALREQDGMAILITDHNVAGTLGVCDRAYVMHEGRVVACGTPEEVLGDPLVQRFYLGPAFSRQAVL